MAIFKAKKLFGSIFFKLFLTVLFSGILINLLEILFFAAYHRMTSQSIAKSFKLYVTYMIEDMGAPPSREKAAAITRQTGVKIQYRGTNEQWSTSDKPFPHFDDTKRAWFQEPGSKARFHRRRLYIFVSIADGEFVFEFSRHVPNETGIRRLHLFLLAMIALVFLGAFFVVRRLMRPIALLEKGVHQVSKGNLEHRIPEKGAAEFKRLAAAFNQMTFRIRSLIKAKERLLLDVSHELRTPVTRAKLALEFLPDSDEKNSIAEDLSEMENLSAGVLESARSINDPQTLHLQPIDMNALVRSVLDKFEGHQPAIVFNPPPEKTIVEVDPEKMKTVLRNIVANALKYSKPDSSPVRVHLSGSANQAILTIRDQGCGIPAEAIPFVFEPFYRADKSRNRKTGGFGLGLSLCKAIMEAHGGKIEIESVLNEGTSVVLALNRKI